MRPLTGAAAGWAGTVRSIRWSPLVVPPAVAVASVVTVRMAVGPRDPILALVGQTAIAFAAGSAAFVVDDATAEAAPAVPTAAPARLLARAAVAVPVVVGGWVAVLAVHRAVAAGPLRPHLATTALAAVAITFLAAGVAGLCAGMAPVASPGAAGLGAVAVAGVAREVVPAPWLALAPPVVPTSVAVVALGFAALVITTRRRRT